MIAMKEVQIIGMAKEGEPLLRPLGSFAIPAGFPSPADDHSEEIDIGKYIVKEPDATYFMKVTGDSMRGRALLPATSLPSIKA